MSLPCGKRFIHIGVCWGAIRSAFCNRMNRFNASETCENTSSICPFFPNTEQVLCRLLCIGQCSDCSGDHPCTRHLDSLRRTAFDMMSFLIPCHSLPCKYNNWLSCSLLLRHFLLTWPLLYSASSQVTFVVCWMAQMTPIVPQTGKCPPLSRRKGL